MKVSWCLSDGKEGSRLSTKVLWYLVASMKPSTNCSPPIPWADVQPHIIRDAGNFTFLLMHQYEMPHFRYESLFSFILFHDSVFCFSCNTWWASFLQTRSIFILLIVLYDRLHCWSSQYQVSRYLGTWFVRFDPTNYSLSKLFTLGFSTTHFYLKTETESDRHLQNWHSTC